MVKVDRLTYFLFFWCIGSTISKLRFPFGGPLRSQELFMVLSCQWKLFELALTKPTFKGDICIVRASWGGGGKYDRPQGFARKYTFCTNVILQLIFRICYYWEIFAGHSFYDPGWCGREDSGAHLLKSLRKMNSVQKVLAGYQSANHEDRIIECKILQKKTNLREKTVIATLFGFLWMFLTHILPKHSLSCSYCAFHKNLPVFSCLGCDTMLSVDAK